MATGANWNVADVPDKPMADSSDNGHIVTAGPEILPIAIVHGNAHNTGRWEKDYADVSTYGFYISYATSRSRKRNASCSPTRARPAGEINTTSAQARLTSGGGGRCSMKSGDALRMR